MQDRATEGPGCMWATVCIHTLTYKRSVWGGLWVCENFSHFLFLYLSIFMPLSFFSPFPPTLLPDITNVLS